MTRTSSQVALATALSFVVMAQPAFAQDQTESGSDSPNEAEPLDDDLHSRQVDFQGNIIISASGLDRLDILAGTSVLEADDIQRNLDGQIGEVLAKLPGVS
ncbi:MAG: hypothetical protein ABJQ14_01610, partial [Hyphomicrobiales bacterium]